MAANPTPQVPNLFSVEGGFSSIEPDAGGGNEITDLAVVSKTATSVTLGWTGIDEVVALERATSPGSFTEIQSGISANASEVTDSSASESTEYHYRLTFAGGTSNTVTVTTNASVSGDWVVYSGASNDDRSPIPQMRLNYPLPDTDTDAGEYHRVYHTSLLQYDVNIDVEFGRWPYRYEKIQGPDWLNVGNELARSLDSSGRIVHTPGVNYGRAYGDPDGDTGNYTVVIRVTDQKGDTLDVQWSITNDDDAFIELDATNGSDANNGISSPLQTFANGLWKNDDNDTTFAGKIAVFNGGEYDINAGTLDTNPIMDASKKPRALVGINGASFNTSRGHFRTADTSNLSGIVFKGISFDGSRTDLPNNRVIFFSHKADRVAIHDCSCTNITPGTADSTSVDNPGWVVFFGLGDANSNYHTNVSFLRNKAGSGVEVPPLNTFDCKGVSHQLCTVDIPAGADHALLIKDDSSDVCVRHNFFRVNTTKDAISMFNQNTKADPIENQEFCYNTIIYTGDQNVDSAIHWNAQTSSPDGQNTHQYANNIVCTNSSQRASRFSGSTLVTKGRDLYVGQIFGGFNEAATGSVELNNADFNSDGILVNGTNRDAYVISHGSEIVGEAA